MKEIRVPRVPKSAFDKHRKPSDLLRRQVEQLEHVVQAVAGPRALPTSAKKVNTEGQAAAFIQQAMRRLHPEGAPARPAQKRPRVKARAKPKAKDTDR